MIKFTCSDGTQPMIMKDNGELEFTNEKVKEDYDKAEKNINKIQDK